MSRFDKLDSSMQAAFKMVTKKLDTQVSSKKINTSKVVTHSTAYETRQKLLIEDQNRFASEMSARELEEPHEEEVHLSIKPSEKTMNTPEIPSENAYSKRVSPISVVAMKMDLWDFISENPGKTTPQIISGITAKPEYTDKRLSNAVLTMTKAGILVSAKEVKHVPGQHHKVYTVYTLSEMALNPNKGVSREVWKKHLCSGEIVSVNREIKSEAQKTVAVKKLAAVEENDPLQKELGLPEIPTKVTTSIENELKFQKVSLTTKQILDSLSFSQTLELFRELKSVFKE